MANSDTPLLEPLEQWRVTAFLIGGAILTIDAGIVAAEVAVGVDRWMVLGQAFVGAGWTAAFLGLLGLYPGLADRSRWLSRAGAVFAAIGAVVFAVMGVASLAYYAGIPDGEIEALVPLFLPGVILGRFWDLCLWVSPPFGRTSIPRPSAFSF